MIVVISIVLLILIFIIAYLGYKYKVDNYE